jgi:hypothetical protein
MTRGITTSSVTVEGGVRVHRLACPAPGLVPEAPAEVDGFSTAVLRELEQMRASWEPDVAYGAFSDLALLAVARHLVGLPIVVDLDGAAVTGVGQRSRRCAPKGVNRALERELLARAILVHGADHRIVDATQHRHPGALHASRLDVAPIGTCDEELAVATFESLLRRAVQSSPHYVGATAST